MNTDQLLAHRQVAVTAMHDAERALARLTAEDARAEWEGVRDACAREVARTDYQLTGPRAAVRP